MEEPYRSNAISMLEFRGYRVVGGWNMYIPGRPAEGDASEGVEREQPGAAAAAAPGDRVARRRQRDRQVRAIAESELHFEAAGYIGGPPAASGGAIAAASADGNGSDRVPDICMLHVPDMGVAASKKLCEALARAPPARVPRRMLLVRPRLGAAVDAQTIVSAILSAARGAIATVEIFDVAFFAIDIARNEFVPRHEILSASDAELVARILAGRESMPKLRTEDRMAKYCGAVAGQIVRIHRAGEEVAYRAVIDGSE